MSASDSWIGTGHAFENGSNGSLGSALGRTGSTFSCMPRRGSGTWISDLGPSRSRTLRYCSVGSQCGSSDSCGCSTCARGSSKFALPCILITACLNCSSAFRSWLLIRGFLLSLLPARLLSTLSINHTNPQCSVHLYGDHCLLQYTFYWIQCCAVFEFAQSCASLEMNIECLFSISIISDLDNSITRFLAFSKFRSIARFVPLHSQA